MGGYSLDLRQKVVTAAQLGNTARSADGPKNRRQLKSSLCSVLLLFIPPYSPDFNPIEMLWSTVKSLVRMFPTRAMSAREQLIELALMLIGTNTFKNWFTKCCYCTN
ncbi:MAG: transposase [Hormoscilla sp. GM102CHS1]|nr:transposase [Hormoscilla sp. GM102CHS1]